MVFKLMKVFDSPWMGHYLFTYLERMESWVSLGGKEAWTNVKISAKPGIEQKKLKSLPYKPNPPVLGNFHQNFDRSEKK